jgi:hypothetical protein
MNSISHALDERHQQLKTPTPNAANNSGGRNRKVADWRSAFDSGDHFTHKSNLSHGRMRANQFGFFGTAGRKARVNLGELRRAEWINRRIPEWEQTVLSDEFAQFHG